MKQLAAVGLMMLVGFALGGCSRDKPASSLVRSELERILPEHVRLAAVELRYSPLTEIMGTTLPAGTWQIQVEAKAELMETLYQKIAFRRSSSDVQLPAGIKVDHERYQRLLKALPDTRFVTITDVGPPPAPSPVLVEVETAGSKRDASFLLAATPIPSGWQIDVLEGEKVADLFAHGRPGSAFGAGMLKHGTVAQRESFERSLIELEQYGQEMTKLVALQTDVDALNRRRDALKKERFRETYAKVSALQQKRSQAVSLHNKEVARILTLGTMANDFRERDAPMRNASAQHKTELEHLDWQIEMAHAAVAEAEANVDEDLDQKISALKVSAGLRQQRVANR